MNNDNYTVEDLLLDEDFRKWVLHPDKVVHTFWEKWIEEKPERKHVAEEAQEIILLAEFDDPVISENKNREMWERLDRKIKKSPTTDQYSEILKAEGSGNPPKQNVTYALFYRVAAIFLGILVLTGVYYFVNRENADIQYVTNYGEVRMITLPDSSRITLNAHSTLRLKKNWNSKKAREVWMEGEAFFEVRKKPDAGNAVFIVHANQLDVEVLGTTFDVQNRRNEPRVILNSGSVKLKMNGGDESSIMMKPGELGEYSAAAGSLTTKSVQADDYSSWRKNQLVFNGNSIREIAQLLEDNYGYAVTIKSEGIAEKKFKGRFPADHPDILLTALSESFHLKVIRKDHQIIIEEH